MARLGTTIEVMGDCDVVEAARERIRWLLAEFEVVGASISGGKDSTIVLELLLEEAQAAGRLPVPVLFVDQEAEWQMVIDHVREVMHRPGVEPYWFQGPIKMSNSTSSFTDAAFLEAWAPGQEWMREREPDSIHVNETGKERFHEMFGALYNQFWPGRKTVFIGGMRADESPRRRMGLCSAPQGKKQPWRGYHGRSWVKDEGRGHYTAWPIYDWSLSDVWQQIAVNNWSYCPLYDWQYRYGIKDRAMRVSSLHHEMSVTFLRYLQAIEPETWTRLVKRLEGIDAEGKIGSQTQIVSELPPMFVSWQAYRDYLLEEMIHDEDRRRKMRDKFIWAEQYMENTTEKIQAALLKCEVQSIIRHDWDSELVYTFVTSHLQDRPAPLAAS